MKKFYETKDVFSFDFGGKMINDVDMKSRTVTGYFSKFGNIDHDGDMVMPGAFSKTIKERGHEGKNLIPHILDHDVHVALKQLSRPILYEKSDGGFFESTISDTTNGLDTLKLYRDKVIDQHSFGYKTTRKTDKKSYTEINESLLYEISTVVLGANEEARSSGFKSFTKPQLVERYNLLTKCYSDGDYSDDIFLILDAQIKQLSQDLLEIFIADTKGTNQTTAPIETSITQPEVSDFSMQLHTNNFLTALKSFNNGRDRYKSIAGGG